MNNNLFDGIKERLDLLPELHRDVIDMSFGLDGGSPMSIEDIAFELRGEYIDLTPEVIKLIQEEGLRMLRHTGQKDEWVIGPEIKDYDPSGFAHLTWKELDHMGNIVDKFEETKKYLREHYAGSDYIVIPSLRELYEYDGDAIGYFDGAIKPGAAECDSLKNDMYNVANLLESMGKILLPDRKLYGDSAAPCVLDYSYLGVEMAERIVLFNTRFTNVTSPVRTLMGMYDATDENGELILPGWFEPTEEAEADYNYKCKMDWDEKSMDELLQDFSEFYLNLLELGEMMYTDPNKLDDELAGLYETLFLYEQTGNTYFEGDSPAIEMLINRSNRFIALSRMNAPLLVQWGEASYIAQAYAIYKCGRSIERIPKQAV